MPEIQTLPRSEAAGSSPTSYPNQAPAGGATTAPSNDLIVTQDVEVEPKVEKEPTPTGDALTYDEATGQMCVPSAGLCFDLNSDNGRNCLLYTSPSPRDS